MRRSWLEVESHEKVPCIPLGGLTATCMSSELQLACRTVWVHPLIEDAAVPTATEQVQISTHTLPPPIQAGQISLKPAQEVGFDTPSHLLLPLPKISGQSDSVLYPLC